MATTPTPATPTTPTPKVIPISGWLMLGFLGLIILSGIIALIKVYGLPSIPEDWKDHGVSQTSSSSARTSNETPARPDYVAAQQPPVSVVINNTQPAPTPTPVVQPPAEEEEVEVEERPVVAEQPKAAIAATPVADPLGLKCSLYFTITDGQFGYPTKMEVRAPEGDNWVPIIEGPIVTNKAGVGQVPLNGPAGTLRRGGFRCKDVGMLMVYLDFNDFPTDRFNRPDFVSFEIDDEDGNSQSFSVLKADKQEGRTYAFMIQALGTTKDGVYH